MDDEHGYGWRMFAATILIFAGIMKVFDSIWAFRAKGDLPGTNTFEATLGNSLKSYGWFWLIIGIILLLSGFLVLQRSQFARWIGIVAAVIMAVGSMAWMPYFPIWALVYVGIAVAVIYALAMYGGRDEVPAA
jgi:succinate-acetate transporter protein